MDMSQHPSAQVDLGNPHARIIAALRGRGGGEGGGGCSSDDGGGWVAPGPCATTTEAPASAGAQGNSQVIPNLPALITALPGDHTRAPQTEFTLARQVQFLENLSVTGSVRSAAARAGVSHQTAYRARRATGAFRLAWDAAMVVARASVEAVLSCRAIDGVEEKVFYHGEEVATRTRYDSRLLLAHLARLDALAERADAAAFAEDWEEELARFGRGEVLRASGVGVGAPSMEVPASAGTQFHRSPAEAGVSGGDAQPSENLSPGLCNTRSMSRPVSLAERLAFEDACAEEEGEECREPFDAEADAEAEEMEGWEDDEEEGLGEPEDYAHLLAGESAKAARLPLYNRLIASMRRHRPANAPRIEDRWKFGRLDEAQLDAFIAGLEDWYCVIPAPPGHLEDEWCYCEGYDPDGDSSDALNGAAPGSGRNAATGAMSG